MPHNPFRDSLYVRQNGMCAICKKHCKIGLSGKQEQDTFTVDHRIPKAVGGTDDLANLQGLCHACNAAKGSVSFPPAAGSAPVGAILRNDPVRLFALGVFQGAAITFLAACLLK